MGYPPGSPRACRHQARRRVVLRLHQAPRPKHGLYYDLYVIIDIYSRYVVGWTVAAREDSAIASELIAHAAHVHGPPGSLHAYRGATMTSKALAQLLVNLGVARSHSRRHVSNVSPFSEPRPKP